MTSLAERLGYRAVDEAGFLALPPIDRGDADDEATQTTRLDQASYEVPAWEWAPIGCAGDPVHPPVRFIDGSLHSRTVAVIRVEGSLRPVILASIGAVELRLCGRRLARSVDGYRTETVLCVAAQGIDTDLVLELRQLLEPVGIRLVARDSEVLVSDFELLRRRAWDYAKAEMEAMERALLLRDPETPSVADGLLEHRLVTIASQRQPAVGMVKQLLRHYLPAALAAMPYELSPGERTPAFLLDTNHARLITWYLRLGEGPMLGPGQGIVRLAMPLEYLERSFPSPAERSREISAVSAWLRQLRCRQESYARAAVSLEPIVRAEEQLQALLPPLEQRAAALRRVLDRHHGALS